MRKGGIHTLEEAHRSLEVGHPGTACRGGSQGVGSQEGVHLACQEARQMASAVFPFPEVRLENER